MGEAEDARRLVGRVRTLPAAMIAEIPPEAAPEITSGKKVVIAALGEGVRVVGGLPVGGADHGSGCAARW